MRALNSIISIKIMARRPFPFLRGERIRNEGRTSWGCHLEQICQDQVFPDDRFQNLPESLWECRIQFQCAIMSTNTKHNG